MASKSNKLSDFGPFMNGFGPNFVCGSIEHVISV